MSDLETLSREIAATSDAWMVPGVCLITAEGVRMRLVGSIGGAGGCRPLLADPVTVNSLLEDRQVYANAPTGNTYWLCYAASEPPGGKHFDRCPDRTTAICRAWIAANREKP